MRKHPLAALVALALLAAVQAATVVAKGRNAKAARSCKASSATLGFKNRGACVSHFARWAARAPAFRTAREAHGGRSVASEFVDMGQSSFRAVPAPVCWLPVMSFAAFEAADAALGRFCDQPIQFLWQLTGTQNYVGCE